MDNYLSLIRDDVMELDKLRPAGKINILRKSD